MAAEEPIAERPMPTWAPLLLAPLIPLFGYGLAFSYELGFANVYGFPSSLISVQPSSFYWALGFALLFFLIIVFGVEVAATFVGGASPWSYLARLLLMIAAFDFFLIGSYRFDLGRTWVALLVSLFFATLLVVYPVVRFSNTQGYTRKLRAMFEEGGQARSPIGAFRRRYGRGLSLVLILCLMCLPFATIYGESAARSQRDYLVLKVDGQEQVVLRIYGPTLITAPLDRKGSTIASSFRVIQVSGGALEMTREAVGPLKFSEQLPLP